MSLALLYFPIITARDCERIKRGEISETKIESNISNILNNYHINAAVVIKPNMQQEHQYK